MKKYKIITLCGSSNFKKEFRKIEKKLTLKGNLVISLNVFFHYDNIKLTNSQKKMLDKIHLRKIDLSDEIFVINKNGYIGLSTIKEIIYAKKLNKIIKYLE